MADPITALAIAGNVAQFIQLGWKVGARIKGYCSSSASAPPVFRELSVQIPLLCDLFEHCRKIDAQTVAKSDSLVAVLDGCMRNITTLDQLVSKVMPDESDTVGAKVWKGIKSVGIQDKFEECRAELETYKTTLALHLSVLTAVQTTPKNVRPALPSFYHVPASGRPRFVGRIDLLELINSSLKPTNRDPRTAVLLGMGGQGKTSLALEYCRREMANKYFNFILWINTSSPATLQRSFAQIAENLAKASGEERVFSDPAACITFVKTAVENFAQPWLFVFDNFDRPEQFKNTFDYAPNATRGAVIITSRHNDCAALGTPIRIPGMSQNDGTELLMQRAGYERTISNLEQARKVVDMLGSLPLGIEQSAAYIRSRKITPGEFMEHYKKRKEKILKHIPQVWGYQRTMDEGGETPLCAFTSWELSFHQAVDNSPDGESTTHFLTVLAFFNNIDIRMEMFQAHFGNDHPDWMARFAPDDEWDELEYQDAVVALADLSLLQYNESTGISGEDDREEGTSFCSVSLHPLVQDWIQLRISAEERRKYVCQALIILLHYIVSAGDDYRNWTLKERRQAMSHVDACLEAQSKYIKSWTDSEFSEIREALVVLCTFYIDDGRYTEAEAVCKQILASDVKVSGATSRAALTSEIRLGNIYLLRGSYHESEAVLSRLRPYVEQHGAQMKVLLFKSLAKAFYRHGRFGDAATLYEEALPLQQSYAADTEFEIMDTKAHLAQVYRNQGRHDEAVELFKNVIDTYRAVNLDDHLGAFQCMADLATAYRSIAQYVLAADFFDQAVAGMSARLSADHPVVLNTRLDMAINLRELQRTEEAEGAFRDLIERFGKKLGPMHPNTLKAIMNLAILYDRCGRPVLAEELYRVALDGREKCLGFENPYTMRTVERLAGLLWTEDRIDEALALAERILRAKQEGDSPEEELATLSVHDSDGKAARYRPMEIIFRRAASRDRKGLGVGHTDRIEAERLLACVYSKQGRVEEAAELQKSVDEGEEIARGRLLSAPAGKRKVEITLEVVAPPPYSAHPPEDSLVKLVAGPSIPLRAPGGSLESVLKMTEAGLESTSRGVYGVD